MQSRQAALVLGIVLIILGVLALIPGVTVAPRVDAPPLHWHAGYGYFLGLFPTNVLLNFLRIALGIGGVVCSLRLLWARGYLRVMTVVTFAAVWFGIIPGLRTLGGFMPLYGNEVWFHLVLLAIVAFYDLGWAVKIGESPDFSNA